MKGKKPLLTGAITSTFDYEILSLSPPSQSIGHHLSEETHIPTPPPEIILFPTISHPPAPALTDEALDLPPNPPTFSSDMPPEPPSPEAQRSTRITTQPTRHGYSATTLDPSDNPTYKQAFAGPDRVNWEVTMKKEWDSFCPHNVGILVDPPEDANIMGGMWVLSQPRDEHHRVIKYKAHYVISGNHQVHSVDFEDTYASFGCSDSMRMLLSIAISEGLIIMQFEICTAFLDGDMVDGVYCQRVKRFWNSSHPNSVWKLNQSFYGSCQGARRWQQKFKSEAAKFGVQPTTSDPAVYVFKGKDGLLLIHIHVDDLLLFCNSSLLLDFFVIFLNSVVEVE